MDDGGCQWEKIENYIDIDAICNSNSICEFSPRFIIYHKKKLNCIRLAFHIDKQRMGIGVLKIGRGLPQLRLLIKCEEAKVKKLIRLDETKVETDIPLDLVPTFYINLKLRIRIKFIVEVSVCAIYIFRIITFCYFSSFRKCPLSKMKGIQQF